MMTKRCHPSKVWYDMIEDWPLIESSFTKQYGIRLRSQKDMPFDEFKNLLSGLMPDTPLGNIVSIRSESDKDIIKNFSKSQKDIWQSWRNKIAKDKLNDVKSLEEVFKSYEKMFELMYSK